MTPARRDLRFEVIDVRLNPAPQGAQTTGWLAYGTLTFGLKGLPCKRPRQAAHKPGPAPPTAAGMTAAGMTEVGRGQEER